MYVKATKVLIEKGIHARPSAKIVEYVLSKKETHVWIEYPQKNRQGNADSVLELLMLEVTSGDTVVIKAEGKDEKEVATYISHILETFKV